MNTVYMALCILQRDNELRSHVRSVQDEHKHLYFIFIRVMAGAMFLYKYNKKGIIAMIFLMFG